MTQTIQQIHDKALGFKERTYDVLLPKSKIGMGIDGNLYQHGSGRSYDPTHLAFRHLASFLKGTKKRPIAPNIGKAVDHLYRDCPPMVRAVVVNHWLEKMPSKELLLRGYDRDGDDGPLLELRAVCSNRYGVVDHHDITAAIMYAFADSPSSVKVASTYMDDAVMHLRLAVPKIAKSFEFGGFRQVYTSGVYISNGTIKNRSLVVSPFVQGTTCTNSTIFSKYGLSRTHSGLSVLAARNTIYEMVGTALNFSEEVMERMFDAALVKIESPSRIIEGIVKKLGLPTDGSDHVRAEVWQSMMSQGGTNHLGLSNGLSHAARKVQDPETRVQMEMMAGDIILAQPDDLFGILSTDHAFADSQ